MTAPVRNLLETFDHLSEAEQAEAASLIIQRTVGRQVPALTDDDLSSAADELFSELDFQEAENAKP